MLACVFIRFCEDNDLLGAPLISGTDSQGRSAVARQEAFYLQHPTSSDNDYLRDVFAVASRLPGLSDVLKVQQSLLSAPVSADMGKQLVRFFRATNADSGALVHDFADSEWNTRFLGDLYQDLSEAARERYALLQTPEFVESFILDRTLTPALDIYTLEEETIEIDPYGTSLPMELRLASKYDLGPVDVSADWVQGFKESAVTSDTGRLSMAAEAHPWSFMPVSFGLSFPNSKIPLKASYSIGLRSRVSEFGIAVQSYNSIFPGYKSKGVSLATSLRLRF